MWVGGRPWGAAWSRCRLIWLLLPSALRRLPHRPRRRKIPSDRVHGRRPREGAAHTVLEFAHLGADSTVRSVTLHPSVGSAPFHGGLAPLEPPWPPSGCCPNAPTARSQESRRRHAWRRTYRYKCGGGGGGGAGSPARNRARPHPSDLSLPVAGKVRSPLSTAMPVRAGGAVRTR
jgi:hypothetical protein